MVGFLSAKGKKIPDYLLETRANRVKLFVCRIGLSICPIPVRENGSGHQAEVAASAFCILVHTLYLGFLLMTSHYR